MPLLAKHPKKYSHLEDTAVFYFVTKFIQESFLSQHEAVCCANICTDLPICCTFVAEKRTKM